MSRSSAKPALHLLQHLCCNRQCCSIVRKGGGLKLLLGLLSTDSGGLMRQQSALAAHVAGCLLALVVSDARAAAAFVAAGGLRVCTHALADVGRYDASAATMRLRLLLTHVGQNSGSSMQLQVTALNACTTTSARGHGSVTEPSGRNGVAPAAAPPGIGIPLGELWLEAC